MLIKIFYQIPNKFKLILKLISPNTTPKPEGTLRMEYIFGHKRNK